jgi:hypothetical protein
MKSTCLVVHTPKRQKRSQHLRGAVELAAVFASAADALLCFVVSAQVSNLSERPYRPRVHNVAHRELPASHLRNDRDLRIRATDWPAEQAQDRGSMVSPGNTLAVPTLKAKDDIASSLF